MILWIIQQLFSLKKAITGRANPSELAWGLALGVAIGLIPKGNLISLMLIGLLVSLRVNHGMATLAAVCVSFLAYRFDPWTHQLGTEVLQAPKTRELMQRFWDMPFVPWTDLNNTVVMGSTIIGLGAVVPTFLVSLPVFRWLAPKKKQNQELDPPPSVALAMPAGVAAPVSVPVVSVPAVSVPKQPQVQTSAPLLQQPPQVSSQQPPWSVVGLSSGDEADTFNAGKHDQTTEEATDPTVGHADASSSLQAGPHIETQIEIIRMKPRDADDAGDDVNNNGPMNETLGYLLRRLRDSRQEKAA